MTRGRAIHKIIKSILDRLTLNDLQNHKDSNVSLSIDSEFGVIRISNATDNSVTNYSIKPKRVGSRMHDKLRPYSVIKNYPNAVFSNVDYCFYTQDGKLIGPAFVSVYKHEAEYDWSDDLSNATITKESKSINAEELFNDLSK